MRYVSLFRRFMIVSWVLFSIATAISAVSFYGLSRDWVARRADVMSILGPPDPKSCDRPRYGPPTEVAIKCEINRRKVEQARLKHIGDYRFGETAFVSRAVAIGILLWNIIWHTGHWIWMGWKAE